MDRIRSFCQLLRSKEGSMNYYHIEGLFYCIVPFVLEIVLLLEVRMVNMLIALRLGNVYFLIELIIVSMFLFFYFSILYFCLRSFVKNLKRKYILFSIITLYLTIISAVVFFNSLVSFIEAFYNIFVVFLHVGENIVFPYQNMPIVARMIMINMGNMMLIYLVLATSFFLNTFLPHSLQKKDIPIKSRMIRSLFKLSIIIIILLFTFIFSSINETNFSSITIFTTIFTFMCTPKTILRLFTNYKNIDNIKISELTLKSFDALKMLYYEFIFSWSIAIYFFKENDPAKRFKIFAIIFFGIVFLTIIATIELKKNSDQLFSNWIVTRENKKYKCREYHMRKKHTK